MSRRTKKVLTPVGYRILIRPDEVEEEEVSEGGIVLPKVDTKMKRAGAMFGTIVGIGSLSWEAFGPEYTGKPWAKEGDRIMFSRYAAKFFEHPDTGETLGIIQDEDVIGIETEVEIDDE